MTQETPEYLGERVQKKKNYGEIEMWEPVERK
jgi:hypothetical protein